MKKVKYVEAHDIKTLENRVNQEISELSRYEIIDVTHNVAITDAKDSYTAQIFYKHT